MFSEQDTPEPMNNCPDPMLSDRHDFGTKTTDDQKVIEYKIEPILRNRKRKLSPNSSAGKTPITAPKTVREKSPTDYSQKRKNKLLSETQHVKNQDLIHKEHEMQLSSFGIQTESQVINHCFVQQDPQPKITARSRSPSQKSMRSFNEKLQKFTKDCNSRSKSRKKQSLSQNSYLSESPSPMKDLSPGFIAPQILKFQSHQNGSIMESSKCVLSYSPEQIDCYPIDSSWISAMEPMNSVSIGAYIQVMKTDSEDKKINNNNNNNSSQKNTISKSTERHQDSKRVQQVSILPQLAYGSLTSMSNIDPCSAQTNSVERNNYQQDPDTPNIFIENQKSSKDLSYKQITFEPYNNFEIKQKIRQNVANKQQYQNQFQRKILHKKPTGRILERFGNQKNLKKQMQKRVVSPKAEFQYQKIKQPEKTADLMFLNWKSQKQEAFKSLISLQTDFTKVAQPKDFKALELIDDEKSKLGKSLIFDKYLKARVFKHLRFRAIQQVLLKNLQDRVSQNRSSDLLFHCFHHLSRHTLQSQTINHLSLKRQSNCLQNAFNAIMCNALNEQKVRNFQTKSNKKTMVKYLVAFEMIRKQAVENRENTNVAQEFREYKLRQQGYSMLRWNCWGGRNVPSDKQIRGELRQAEKIRQITLKKYFFAVVKQMVYCRYRANLAKHFYRQNLKQRSIYNLQKYINQQKIEKMYALRDFRAEKSYNLMVKSFSALLFNKDEMKKLRIQKRKYTFFMKNRVFKKWIIFMVKNQEQKIKLNYFKTRWQLIHKQNFLTAFSLQILRIKASQTNYGIIFTKNQIINQYFYLQKWKQHFRMNIMDRRQLSFRAFKAIKKNVKIQQNSEQKIIQKMDQYKYWKTIAKVIKRLKQICQIKKKCEFMIKMGQKRLISKIFDQIVRNAHESVIDGKTREILNLKQQNTYLEKDKAYNYSSKQSLQSQIESYQNQMKVNLEETSNLKSQIRQKCLDLEKAEISFKKLQENFLQMEQKMVSQNLDYDNLSRKLSDEKKFNLAKVKKWADERSELLIMEQQLQEKLSIEKEKYQDLQSLMKVQEVQIRKDCQNQQEKQMKFINDLIRQNDELRNKNSMRTTQEMDFAKLDVSRISKTHREVQPSPPQKENIKTQSNSKGNTQGSQVYSNNNSHLRLKTTESESSDLLRKAIFELTPIEMFNEAPRDQPPVCHPPPKTIQPKKAPIKPYTQLKVNVLPESNYTSAQSPRFQQQEPNVDELAQRFLDNLEHNKNIILKENISNYIQ